MKGIEKLHEFLKNGYDCYLSSNATEMKSYCNNIPNYKGLVRMRNNKDEKILVLAYLTTTKEIETEISVSNDFLVKDH